ncbi:class II glutamine amidotransferase [Streptomyces sp. HNM0575]|uniref:class II glutamine amidotransferase n=1 Tax=Streptomyces sp. HNM0575 TaxID=2716338 RepID=UPI00145DAA46|nr:class II glutamine amidotransferase [Streptomyces sp. HNM0575]NLU73056.1 class II glutamine amidotransferase [Streptomyces sp. HNM0575]
MCRHLAYLGPPSTLADVVLAPPKGLYEQSWAPRMQRYGTVNADGFGLGWYPEPEQSQSESRSRPDTETETEPEPDTGPQPEPARYRRAVPVWADVNLRDLTRAVRSTAVLAAVRDATEGTAQDETAAAPYADGRLLFSHNGAVSDWERLVDDLGAQLEPAALLALEARCDSALLWALLTRRIRDGHPAEEALAWLAVRVAEIRPGARLNFLLTDGRTIWATRRGDTLWYRTGPGSVRVASEPDAAAHEPESAHASVPAHQEGSTAPEAEAEAEPGWQEVPEDSLLVATVSSVRTVPLVHAAGRAPDRVSGGADGIHARRT